MHIYNISSFNSSDIQEMNIAKRCCSSRNCYASEQFRLQSNTAKY